MPLKARQGHPPIKTDLMKFFYGGNMSKEGGMSSLKLAKRLL